MSNGSLQGRTKISQLICLGTAALAIGPSRVATAAPIAQTCFGGGPCPTPPPTPPPSCPTRSSSSKPIGNILILWTGGITVEQRLNGTTFLVIFDLQPNHAFKSSVQSCIFDDGVATRFDQSSNIQSTATLSQAEHEAAVEVVPINPNAATVYRFRLKYQHNFDPNSLGNPKFRTCSLALPSGLTPGQIVTIPPTSCSADG